MQKKEAELEIKKMNEIINYCENIINGENVNSSAVMIKLTALQSIKYAEFFLHEDK